jgi:peptide/nickel transport system substrate-binding protein
VPRSQTLIMSYEGGHLVLPPVANSLLGSTQPAISAGLHQLVDESLFYLNYYTGKPEPWLATGYKYNAQFSAVTIKLRHGVQWGDGKPFTSKDVAFTLRLLKKNPSFVNAGPVSAVASVRTPDPHTVVIKLTKPDPRFVLSAFSVYIWGGVVILPEHIWQGRDAKTFRNFDLKKGWPLGTGPYRLVGYTSDSLTFMRNDNWWAAKTGFAKLPKPKKVIFKEGTEDSRIAELSSNRLDGAAQISLPGFLKARSNNKAVIAWSQKQPYGWFDPCPSTFIFNTQVKPWNDPEMRWGLNYTIDKRKFSNLQNQGAGDNQPFLFPDYGALNSLVKRNADLLKKYPVLAHDNAKADAIWRAKGYHKSGGKWVDAGGKPLTIDLTMINAADGGVGWGIGLQALTQFFQDDGLTVESHALGLTNYFTTLNTGKYEVAGSYLCGSVTDPWATLDNLNGKHVLAPGEAQNQGFNQPRWKNAQYDAIVNKIGRLAPGDRGIPALFRKALVIYLKALPEVNISQPVRLVPYNTKYWTNWPTRTNPYFQPSNWWANFHQVILKLRPSADGTSRPATR